LAKAERVRARYINVVKCGTRRNKIHIANEGGAIRTKAGREQDTTMEGEVGQGEMRYTLAKYHNARKVVARKG
jgi:hypothetical protein